MKTLFLVLLLIAMPVCAEEVVEEVESFSPKVSGFLDVRPTYASKTGSFSTENTADISYAITEDISVGYRQYILTNLYEPSLGGGDLNLQVHDGFAKANFANLWVSEDEKTSFSYQPRIYLPTYEPRRAAGMLFALRNYFTLAHQVSDSVTLSFVELPIFHVFDRPGNVDADGEVSSNPFFENRLYFMADFQLTQKLSLSLNLFFHQARRRDNAQDSADDWAFFLWTYPEINYALNDNAYLGLAYYSDNLIQADLSGLDLGNGFEKGLWQLVFGVKV